MLQTKFNVVTPLLSAVAVESAGFMNALTSAASATHVRKRKRVSTIAKVLLVTYNEQWNLLLRHHVISLYF